MPNSNSVTPNLYQNPLQDRYPLKKPTPAAPSITETNPSQLRRPRTQLSDSIKQSEFDRLKKKLVYKPSQLKREASKLQTIPEETQENQPIFSLNSIVNILIASLVSLKNTFLSLCNWILNTFKPSKRRTANITQKSVADTKRHSNLTIFATAEDISNKKSSIVGSGPAMHSMTARAG